MPSSPPFSDRISTSEPVSTTSLLPPPVSSADEEQRANTRLQLFMGTRLGVATLLLGGTLLIALDDEAGFDAFTPRFLVTLIAAIYAASLVFAVWLLGSAHRERVALAQVGTDLVVTTGLVYVTGGSGSGFTFLYGVAVLMAAMVIGPLAARVTGASAILLYGALSAALSTGWLAPPLDQNPETYLLSHGELAYAGLLNVLGLLLVTLLAGNLSARLLTTGGQLRLAEQAASTLAQLNDDIVRSLSSGLMTTDLGGRVHTMNPSGLEMFDAHAHDVVGRPVSELMDVDVQPYLSTRDTPSTPQVVRAEGVATRPDASQFPVGYTINPLTHIDGSPIGAMVLFQDLSEITRLREIAARGERLAVLGRLSAGLAHEIRNPLSSISGSVQLVRDSPELDEEDRKLLGIILTEVERLDDLVTTMLEVGTPREPHRQPVDLRQTATDVVQVASRGMAASNEVCIEADVPEVPVMATVDGAQIRQVVWNLVKNAIQASPKGARVTVRALEDTAGTPVLEVIDQGRGLDEGQRDKVYNMFYSERTQGAGIGLALVRQIVDAHGAHIEIRSEQGRGATFAVSFPRQSSA